MRGIFIAGTDTGVGKTELGCALLARWAARGAAPRALKPVETGCAPGAPEDALALRAACGPPHDALLLDEVCPYRFRLPAAPLVAAEAEGRAVELGRIDACVRAALDAGGPLLVESAGGLLVPLFRAGGRIFTNLDLAAHLGFPVLLVGRAGLGTINHCALSAQALAQRGVALLAIALNRTTAESDPSMETNARAIQELTAVRTLGPGPFEPERKKRPAALAGLVAFLDADILTKQSEMPTVPETNR